MWGLTVGLRSGLIEKNSRLMILYCRDLSFCLSQFQVPQAAAEQISKSVESWPPGQVFHQMLGPRASLGPFILINYAFPSLSIKVPMT